MRIRSLRSLLFPALLLLWVSLPPRAQAFPEFQAYSQQHSGRPVNCGMCHTNPDGPTGSAPGQLGRLTPAEMDAVNQARAAISPGVAVQSPILNAFGNQLIKELGAKQLLLLQKNPDGLASALNSTGDLDGDGIPNVREYLDGTDPLDRMNGAPGLLLLNNLQRHWPQVLFMLAVIGLLVFGFNRIIHGLRMTDTAEAR